MNVQSNQPVCLKVHLSGAIAYVPEESGKLWALLPNALLPTPARWRQTKRRTLLPARAPHIALLLADKDLIVPHPHTTGDISAIVEQWPTCPKNSNSMPPTVAIPLLGEGLDFEVPSGRLDIDCEVTQHLPRIAAISRAHRKVSRHFLPTDRDFYRVGRFGLSSAFPLKSGRLTVEDYFGGKESPFITDFGYVLSILGLACYWGRTWHSKIANRLLWTVQLPANQRRVTIKNMDWERNTKTQYVLEAPRYSNTIEIAIMHSEVEVSTLFFKDPVFPDGVRGLPDPDFELFYDISSYKNRWWPWRVPIPSKGTPVGVVEKPCTGGLFEGFAS